MTPAWIEIGRVDDIPRRGARRVRSDGAPIAVFRTAEGEIFALVDRCPPGTYHLAGSGSCSWYELATAIMTRAGLPARVVPIGSDELDRPAPRPACSILRSEHACTPTLPPWQTGLEACLYELSQQEVPS